MLKHLLDTKPKLKKVIDNLIENPNPELADIVTPIIQEKLKQARMQGIFIGWNTFAIQAIENIKNMESVDEIKTYFQSEADKMKDKLGLSKDNVENQGISL